MTDTTTNAGRTVMVPDTAEDLARFAESQVAPTDAGPQIDVDAPDGAGAEGGLADLFSYYNPDNRCGQAAMGTLLDYWGKNPWNLARGGNGHWDNAQLLDAASVQFGMDVVLGFGTTGGRILDACKFGGLRGTVCYSGFASAGWDQIWNNLVTWVNANHPVAVLFDSGAISNQLGYHWGVVYRIDGDGVWIGNCPWKNPIPVAEFQHLWHSDKLPYGFNHCSVFVQP